MDGITIAVEERVDEPAALVGGGIVQEVANGQNVGDASFQVEVRPTAPLGIVSGWGRRYFQGLPLRGYLFVNAAGQFRGREHSRFGCGKRRWRPEHYGTK